MFNIEKQGKTLEVYLYEIIGNFMGEGVSAKDFAKALEPHADAEQITLYINSPGGIVWDGVSIYNILKRHKAQVTAYVDGLAASIASLILQAGDTRVIADGALVMVHKPWSCVCGNVNELLSEAAELEKVEDSLVDIYSKRSGKDAEAIKALLAGADGADGTYLDADEAVELGFVDTKNEAKRQAALDTSILAKATWLEGEKIPTELAKPEQQEEPQEAEQKETETKTETNQLEEVEMLAKLDSIINNIKQ